MTTILDQGLNKQGKRGYYQKNQNLLFPLLLRTLIQNIAALMEHRGVQKQPEEVEIDTQEQDMKRRSFQTFLCKSAGRNSEATASKHLFNDVLQKSDSSHLVYYSSTSTFSLEAFEGSTAWTTTQTCQAGVRGQGKYLIKKPSQFFGEKSTSMDPRFKVKQAPLFSQYNPTKIIHRSRACELFIIQSIRESKKKIMKMTFKVGFSNGKSLYGWQEIYNYSTLSHPGLPVLDAVYQECNKYLLVLQYIEGVTLAEYIQQHTVTEEVAKIIVRQLLEILEYLHGQSLVHRDIRPEHVFVSNFERDPLQLKIYLMDLSSLAPAHQLCKERISSQTPGQYASPQSTSGVVNTKHDIWSVGILTMVLLCQFDNFSEDCEQFLEALTQKSQFYQEHIKNIPLGAVKFINYLLVSKSLYRPCASQALAHGWLGTGEGRLYSSHRRKHEEQFIAVE